MRRAVFYFFYDPQGRVDDFVLRALDHLRPHAEHIFVVSNVMLDGVARARLEGSSDQVWERENVGLDVWAYKEAMAIFGRDRLAAFDELVLANATFFGPMDSFDDLFARTDDRDDIDFWGISEHGAWVPHPFDPRQDRMDAHIQSHWIAVRREMFTSQAWDDYWSGMPMITGYFDSVVRHEGVFTSHFAAEGFRPHVVWPASDYPSAHPIMDNAELMLRDGCPIMKRRTFFADPLYNEQHAIDGRRLLLAAGEAGYPVEMVLANLARTSVPRALVTNLGLLEVLPDIDTAPALPPTLRVVAVLHLFYPEMTNELLDRLELLPVPFDLVVTTTTNQKASQVAAVLAGRGVEADIRIVASNRGRDVSAFVVGCRDILESDDYDLVVKLHSKKSPQDEANLATMFKRHLLENLLSSRGYAANLLRLFEEHSSLGMVFPPVIHIGYPTMGHAWFGNVERARIEAERIGITVPFDDLTPLAAYGSMYIARPAALRTVAAVGYTYDDFPDEDEYADGALSHTLERLMAYAALSAGYHVREVLSPELAPVAYRFLEYKHQAAVHKLPADPFAQPAYLDALRSEADAAVGLRVENQRLRRQVRAARRAGQQKQPAPRPILESTSLSRVTKRVSARYQGLRARGSRPGGNR